jgi:transcriptional regulator with XRE-family HTH domain
MPRTASKAELRYDEDLARGLMRARLACGIGLKEAAGQVGLDLTSIWRFENGKMNPRLSTLQALVALYRANLNIGPDGVMLTWMEEPSEDGSESVAPTKGGK